MNDKPELKVLLFYSNTCSACDVLLFKVENLIEKTFPEFSFEKIDVAKDATKAVEYSVLSGPTVLVLIDGKEYIREGANMSVIEFQSKLERLLSLMK